MQVEIRGNPDYGQLVVRLGPRERFIAEGGSMVWMGSGVRSKARLLGGFLRALVRKLTGRGVVVCRRVLRRPGR